MPNSPDPLPTFADDGEETESKDTGNQKEIGRVRPPRVHISYTDITVGELRKEHGPGFAKDFVDTDLVSTVLDRAGVDTLQEYLSKHRHSETL